MTRNYPLLLVLCFLTLEIVLINFVDLPLSEFLRNVDQQHPDYIDIFRAYTDIGKSKYYLIISGISILLCACAVRMPSIQKELRIKMGHVGKVLSFFFACVAVSGIVADIIKPILGRARPVTFVREGIYGFHPFTFHAAWNSMPSGHATTAFTIATILTFFRPRHQVLWFVGAAIIAVSRVMVNAHYLSDIFAGAAVGILTVLLIRRLVNHNVINHMSCVIFPIDSR